MKSLGQKLHDAAIRVWPGRDWHDDERSEVQAEYERVALAFAASLSHDETATATIEGLRELLAKTAGVLQVAIDRKTTARDIIVFNGAFSHLGAVQVSELLDAVNAALNPQEARNAE